MDKLNTEIWHTTYQPNVGQKVIVIDENNDIFDFGYFHYNDYIDFRKGHKWAYMIDLIKETNGEKE